MQNSKPLKLKKMKKLFFSICATITFSLSGISQDKTATDLKVEFKSASLITQFENERIEYKFLSLLDLDENLEHFIQDFNFNNLKHPNHDTCQITIEINLELVVGSSIGFIKGSIAANWKEAALATKRLKAMVIAASIS